MTDETNPLSSARDRIQASAREMMKSFEAAVNPPTSSKITKPSSSESKNKFNEGSLEQAFRLFFSSCTTGATVLAEDDEDDSVEDNTAADLTPVSTLPSHDSGSISTTPSKKKPPQHKTNSNRSLSAPPRRPSASLRNLKTMRTRSSNNDVFREPKIQSSTPIAEHIYEQLFLDQELAERDTTNERRIGAPRFHQSFGRPFPASSPMALSSSAPHLVDHTEDDIIIQHNTNQLDDEISAISAHTLEAMAHHPRHGAGGGSVLLAPDPALERHLSSLSGGTPSTGTSSASFEQWQAAEKSYWAQQAVRTEKRRRRKWSVRPNFDLSETAEI